MLVRVLVLASVLASLVKTRFNGPNVTAPRPVTFEILMCRPLKPGSNLHTNNLPFSYHQAEEFCTYHGLNVIEGCVNFARSSYVEPETRFPVKRALKLIESKRNSSIGEVGLCLST